MAFKIKDFLYYTAFILEIIYTIGSDIPVVGKISNYLNILIILLLSIIFVVQSKKYPLKKFIFLILSLFLFIVSSYVSKNKTFIILYLFVVSSKDIDFKKIMKVDMITKILLTMLIVISWKFGLMPEKIMIRGDLVRHSWGFNHPNLFGLCIFSIGCDYFFIKYKKTNIIDYLFFAICFIICTIICGSRSAQIGLISVFIFSKLLPKIENKTKSNKFMVYLPAFLLLLSYFITIIYPFNLNIINTINGILSSRIKLSYSFLSYYGINLWGHYFQYYNVRYTYAYFYALDNAYMYMLIKYGLVLTTLIIFLFSKIIKKSIDTKNYQVLVYLLPFLIYGLMEKYLIIFQYNIVLLYGTSTLLFNKKILEHSNISNGGVNNA